MPGYPDSVCWCSVSKSEDVHPTKANEPPVTPFEHDSKRLWLIRDYRPLSAARLTLIPTKQVPGPAITFDPKVTMTPELRGASSSFCRRTFPIQVPCVDPRSRSEMTYHPFCQSVIIRGGSTW